MKTFNVKVSNQSSVFGQFSTSEPITKTFNVKVSNQSSVLGLLPNSTFTVSNLSVSNLSVSIFTVNTLSIANNITIGTGSINSISYSGTSNNTLFVGTTSAANVVSNNQLFSNLALYTNTALTLANDATTYSNAVAYSDSKLYVNTLQLSANLALYSNTLQMQNNTAAAYTNAVSRVNHTDTQLASTISDFSAAVNTEIDPIIRISYVSDHPGTLTKGMVVCLINGKLRRATSVAPFHVPIGLMFEESLLQGVSGQVQTNFNLTTTPLTWNNATGMIGGLSVGQPYFLNNVGAITPYAPTEINNYVVPVGLALSATTLRISFISSVKL